MANKIEEGLKKSLFAALGFASITKEKAKKIAKELIKRGEISEKDLGVIAGTLLEKTKKGKEVIESGMAKIVEKIMARMDIPTKKRHYRIKKNDLWP